MAAVRSLICLVLATGCGRYGFAVLGDGDVDGETADAAQAIPDLIVRYPMDDGAANAKVTSTSSAYDATCGSCPQATTGVFGGAYRFAQGQYVQLPAMASSLVGASPYTVALWIRPDNQDQRNAISKPLDPTSDANPFALFSDPNGTVTFESTPETSPGTYDLLSSTPAINVVDGGWHHVVGTWDGTTKRLYIDGALHASSAATIADSALPVYVGVDRDSGALSRWYVGDEDDLRFYARALTADEITILATR